MSLITFGLGASASRLILLGFLSGDVPVFGRASTSIEVPPDVRLMTVEPQPPIVVAAEG